jgi:hypothetical protein
MQLAGSHHDGCVKIGAAGKSVFVTMATDE